MATGSTGADELDNLLSKEDQAFQEQIKSRVQAAIALAATELDDDSLDARMELADLEKLQLAQRAQVQVMLNNHDDKKQQLRSEVEDTLSGLLHAEATFRTFSSEVDDIDVELRELTAEGDVGQQQVEQITVTDEVRRQNADERMRQIHTEVVAEAFFKGQEKSNAAGSVELQVCARACAPRV